jgi:hypothetical protein
MLKIQMEISVSDPNMEELKKPFPKSPTYAALDCIKARSRISHALALLIKFASF